jgi:hypothetical protein
MRASRRLCHGPLSCHPEPNRVGLTADGSEGLNCEGGAASPNDVSPPAKANRKQGFSEIISTSTSSARGPLALRFFIEFMTFESKINM